MTATDTTSATNASTPWDVLERMLIVNGTLTPEGVGRRAQPRRCPECRQPILVGLDADQCTLRADVDPTPVTALGELLAQLEHRRTYALVHNAGRLVLDYRDAGRIRYRPAGTPRQDVLVEHRCGTAYSRFPHTTSCLTRTVLTLTEGAPCPF